MSCLTEDAVAEFVEGRMRAEEASAVDRHMADCAACRSLVADVAKIAFDDESPPRAGDTVGRYRLLEVVGVGGMGVVYAADDPELGRRIALKLIRADRASTPGIELTKRLHHEARAMAQISHPNVVTVHDIGTIGQHLFVAMEYVHGKTMREWRAAAERSWQEILDAFLAAGRGLVAAHDVGLVHRDFKPENVLYGEDGRVRVTDFGLARADFQVDGDDPRRESTLAGTPAYMAPEQLAGAPADARSDQYSFCVTLFEALYGVRPRRLESPPAAAGVPGAVYPILVRGLRPKPEDRFPSMQALLDELTALRPKASAAPRTRRRYVLLGSALVVCVIGGAWRISAKRSAHSTHVFPREPGAGECPRGKGLYCAAHGVDGESATLYRCAGGTIIEEKKCNVACMHLGRGAMDACDGDSPACPFGGSGVYCGFNYLSANPKTLYRCSDGKVTVEEECRTRCIEAPDRVEDHCE